MYLNVASSTSHNLSTPTTPSSSCPSNDECTAVPPSNPSSSIVSTVNQRDSLHNTPLHLAVNEGDEAAVRTQLLLGANTNHQNFAGFTPLLAALSQGFLSIACLLLNHGADPNICNVEGVYPLHFAVTNGDESTILELLKNGAFLNVQDEEGDSALHWAIREGREDTVAWLLKRAGIQVNIKNEDGETPLHLASSLGEERMVEHLLASKADVYARDNQGLTPLDEAVEQHQPIAKMLYRSMKASKSSPSSSSPSHRGFQKNSESYFYSHTSSPVSSS